MRCVVSLDIRSGGGTRAARLCRYLDQLDPDTVLLAEWRDNASGRAFANWAEDRGMSHAGLTDGYTANGVFLASSDPFAIESATPSAQGPGCLMLARFRHVTLLARYFPQLSAKAAFFGRCFGASGPGTPPKVMAFGSTMLLAMAHSLQRPPQPTLTTIARVKSD